LRNNIQKISISTFTEKYPTPRFFSGGTSILFGGTEDELVQAKETIRKQLQKKISDLKIHIAKGHTSELEGF
jgi:hypothetical protein